MRLARRSFGWVGAFCLLFGGTAVAAADAPPVKPAEKPAAKPAGKSVIPAAVAALQKEFQAYAKDPNSGKLREKSDYFKDHPATDMTPDVILKALEASAGSTPAADAYVKWQLLSAVPEKFDDDEVKRAVAVYRRAPQPIEHPGMDRKGLARAVRTVKANEIGGYQRDLDGAVDRNKELNNVFLSYRDELFSRLPNKVEALYAGLEDVSVRAGAGLNAVKIFDNVSAGIRSWSIADAKAGQVPAMIDAVSRLKNQVGNENAKPYVKLAADDKGTIKWQPGNAAVDPKKVDELIKFLDNAASSGIGGLKFKDNKK